MTDIIPSAVLRHKSLRVLRTVKGLWKQQLRNCNPPGSCSDASSCFAPTRHRVTPDRTDRAGMPDRTEEVGAVSFVEE